MIILVFLFQNVKFNVLFLVNPLKMLLSEYGFSVLFRSVNQN